PSPAQRASGLGGRAQPVPQDHRSGLGSVARSRRRFSSNSFVWTLVRMQEAALALEFLVYARCPVLVASEAVRLPAALMDVAALGKNQSASPELHGLVHPRGG